MIRRAKEIDGERIAEIHPLNKDTEAFFNCIDNSRLVAGKIHPVFDDSGNISFEIRELTHTYPKDRDDDDSEREEYIANPGFAGYFAVRDNRPVGQILLQTYWNNLASIEDIRIAPELRHRGIGSLLIQKAVEWAKEKGLKGLRLETQDNNIQACLFYHSRGFSLRGFDRSLYAGLEGLSHETALYWYLLFEEGKS